MLSGASHPGYIDTYYRRTLQGETPYPPLTGAQSTGIAIIGGGLAGLTCALELAQRGHDVTLLEAQRVGWGASGRNGGSVSPAWSANDSTLRQQLGDDHYKALHRLSIEGMNMVRHYAETLAGDSAHIVPGHLKVSLYNNADGFQHQRDQQERWFDRRLRYLTRPEVQEILRSPRYHQGLYSEDGFHFHPLNYCQALARECTRLGVHIHENTTVLRTTRDAGQRILHTADGSVKADQVVICTGGHTGDLVPQLQRAYLPIATYIMLSEPLGPRLHEIIRTRAALGDTRRAGNYYRIVDDDRLQWGGHITTRTSNPRSISTLLQRELAACYPQLGPIKIEMAWSGLMSYARHRMPQIGRLAPDLWYCTAFGGHGVNSSAIGARVVAEALDGASDRYRLFAPFKLAWNGGLFGKAAVQLTYWRYQLLDQIKERTSV